MTFVHVPDLGIIFQGAQQALTQGAQLQWQAQCDALAARIAGRVCLLALPVDGRGEIVGEARTRRVVVGCELDHLAIRLPPCPRVAGKHPADSKRGWRSQSTPGLCFT